MFGILHFRLIQRRDSTLNEQINLKTDTHAPFRKKEINRCNCYKNETNCGVAVCISAEPIHRDVAVL